MKLSAQVAALTAGLAVATAIVIGGAGYAMTRSGLDHAIDRSIQGVVGDVGGDRGAAEATCGIDNHDQGRALRPRPRRQFRDVLVQCIDTTGAIIATSPITVIPVSDLDRSIAAGDTEGPAAVNVTIDDEHLRVVTVGVSGVGAVQAARSVDERDDLLSRLLVRIGLVTVASFVSASLAGAWLARRIAGPIVALTDVADRIDRSGNLDEAVLPETTTGDETRRLAHAFAGMVGSLRASRDAQARLVQDAGHELRTPLTSIRTNVSLLRRADLPAARRDSILADLDSELRELTDITNELVSLAADGARDEVPATIDLAAIASASAARWARRSGRTISAHTESEYDANVIAGPVALQRAVDNLVSNAVKFSPSGSPVDVAVTRAGQHVVFTVADRGAGVADVDRERIFERFYRSDEARSVSGSGLGLSIVAQVARTAGGSVRVENRDGGGSVFTLTLPAAG